MIIYMYIQICRDAVPLWSDAVPYIWDESHDSPTFHEDYRHEGNDLSTSLPAVTGKVNVMRGHAMQFGALGCIYPEKLLIAWISLQRAYYKKYTMSNCTSRFTEQNNKLHVRVTVFFPKLVWVNRPQRVIDKGITMPCWPWSLSVITAE